MKTMRADSDIRHDVLQELDFGPKIGLRIDADAITVEIADNGTVILQGSVRSAAEREEAARAAESVAEVITVENRLQVVG